MSYLARFPGGYRGLIEPGVEALTIEAHARYLAPCGFDDELRLHTRVTHLKGARFRFEYVLERLNEPVARIAEGWTGHACVDAQTLRPTRMPPWLAEGIRVLSLLLHPWIPDATGKLLDAIGEERRTLDAAVFGNWPGAKVGKIDPLFPRVDG